MLTLTPANGRPATIPSRLGWCLLAALLGASAVGLFAIARVRGPSAVDIAASRVVSAVAQGVAISLHETPQDERGLVMITTRLDEREIRIIQQTPSASRAFVEEVAARYPISAETRHYIAGALIGLSQICADFPPPRGASVDPNLLKLIVAFRVGVRTGVANHHSAGA